MIELKSLSKSYVTPKGRHYVFKNLDAVLPENKSVALLGKNGAGKSTLLRIIGGMDFADSGRVITNKTYRVYVFVCWTCRNNNLFTV